MNRSRLLPLVETAVMVALAYVLNLIIVFKMPNGGSVTAGSMIPILLIGLRHGTRWGVTAGVLFGFLQALMAESGYIVSPVQMLIDYPVAFGVLGLAGLAANKTEWLGGMLSALAIIGRFAAHVISGVIYFASYAPEGQNVWVYSLGYNASYMVPEMIISAVLLVLLHPALRRVLPTRNQIKGAA